MAKTYRSPINYGINTCHAPLLLRKDLVEHLAFLKGYCGFEYARCHGVLDDSIHVASREGDGSSPEPLWAMVSGAAAGGLPQPDGAAPAGAGKLRFHFQQAHKVYENLVEAGYTPLVELSFLPRALAADPTKTCCFYKGLCSAPTSYEEWGGLIEAMGRSLVNRFGLGAVAKWKFTVWNEPNGGFWFPPEDRFEAYLKLYEAAATGLKRVSKRLQVGGPATMVAGWAMPGSVLAAGAEFGRGGPSEGEGWVEAFMDHFARHNVPVDFIETHLYPMDEYELYKQRTRELFGPYDFFTGTIAKVNAAIARRRANMEVIWGEWSSNHRVTKPGVPTWEQAVHAHLHAEPPVRPAVRGRVRDQDRRHVP